MLCSGKVAPKISSIWNNNVRLLGMNKLKATLEDLFTVKKPSNEPPYSHVCQIGDPVLRKQCMPVNPEKIQTDYFQKALDHIKKVMWYYGAAGLSAPQIGLPWQVFVVEVTEDDLSIIDPKIRKARQMEQIPLTFFINPRLKIKDHEEATFPEMCQSVCGYTAHVSRPRVVEIEALDRKGQRFTWLRHGWPARIIQHEYDHLHGVLYVDKMITPTFQCSRWQEVNDYSGKIMLPFLPRSSVK